MKYYEPKPNTALFNLMVILIIMAIVVGIICACYFLPIRLVMSIGFCSMAAVAIGWTIRGLSR